MSYCYKEWKLYRAELSLRGKQQKEIYFFSRWQPKNGVPSQLPDGYVVVENQRTGLPHLFQIDPTKKTDN